MAFEKRNMTIPTNPPVTLPIVRIGELNRTMVELADGRKRPQTFAEVISLRETNPNGPNPGHKYPQLGYENMFFTTPRYEDVEGLDYEVDADTGEKLLHTEQSLVAKVEKSRAALVANARPQVVSLD